MSVTIKEVIENGGYDLSTYEDCVWLISIQNEFLELIEQAESIVEKHDDDEEGEDE